MVNSILATLNTVGYALRMMPDACSMSSIP
jgi:hypothetical protein